MDLIVSKLRIPVEQDGSKDYLEAAAARLDLSPGSISLVRMLNKELDASDKEQFFYEISLVVRAPDSYDNPGNLPEYASKAARPGKPPPPAQRPLIIGFGPAGMFAALELLARGIKPLIFERGKKIEQRSADVQEFLLERSLDPESNIQFGEGGAGAYSDGKLFSRVNNSGPANRVLETFIKFGAPGEIGYVRKPHLGTDALCRIVGNIRRYILERGGEIRYGAKMTDLLTGQGSALGIVVNGRQEYTASSIYLAVGNSSRETFRLLRDRGIMLEPRPVAVGVRLEHPAEEINLLRYGGKYRDFAGLGAATYSFTHTNRQAGRGVYSFCMCPGGEVINASSEEGLLVVNGMSYSGRSSPFSNSAIVVTCHTSDYGSGGPLAGIEFQQAIEGRAFAAAGGNWKVPAQNLMDFIGGKVSRHLPAHSYKMGAAAANLHDIFPPFITTSLLEAFAAWQRQEPGFVSERALVLGAETRTSCPVRIMRSERYESVSVKNLYPIGEGSGYAGGITSSAIDAIKAVGASLGD